VHCSEQLNCHDYVLLCFDILKLTHDNDIKPECFMNLWFLPRDAVLTQYMLLPCLSVRPSQATIVVKWLNLGSRKQRHTISSDSSFLTPKILRKFEWGHPHLDAKYMCGRFNKSFIFDHCLAICHKRCKMGTWLQWKANRNLYMLICCIKWCYFQWPWVTPKYPSHPSFYILHPL